MTIAANSPLPEIHTDLAPSPFLNPRLWISLVVWFAGALALATTGVFTPPAGTLVPAALLSAAIIPPAMFLAAYAALPALRAWVAALDLATVTAMQAWRVVGLAFVFLWLLGDLPAVFAVPAGFGDVAVGLAAVAVAARIWHRAPGWRGAAGWLIVAGFVDFAVAIVTGVLSGAGGPLTLAGAPSSAPLVALPLVLIPAFGVPAFMILHLIAWLKLRAE